MGYEYSEYRKDSHAPLKDKEVTGREKLSKYEAREEKRKEGKEPKEKLLLENTYGVVNLGISDKKEETKKRGKEKQERLITVSGMREDRGGNPRDTEFLRETGSVAMKPYNRRGFTNSHDKENSAVGLRMQPGHTGEKVVAHLQNLAEKEKLDAVQQMMPFLMDKEEKAELYALREKRKQEGKLDVEKEKYLELLMNNQMHREQKKKELIESLNRIIRNKEKQETKEEKKKSKAVEFLWEFVEENTDGETGEAEEAEETDESEEQEILPEEKHKEGMLE